MKVLYYLLLLVPLLQGCFPDFSFRKDDRLYVKEIATPSGKVEWFFYSSAYVDSPDYITLEVKGKKDTICISENIANIDMDDGKVIIGFYGSPKSYSELIHLPTTLLGNKIMIDTNYSLPTPQPRKFYTREK